MLRGSKPVAGHNIFRGRFGPCLDSVALNRALCPECFVWSRCFLQGRDRGKRIWLCRWWGRQSWRRRTDFERGLGRPFARKAFQVLLQATSSHREAVLELQILGYFLVARAQILEFLDLVCETRKFSPVSLLSLFSQKLV